MLFIILFSDFLPLLYVVIIIFHVKYIHYGIIVFFCRIMFKLQYIELFHDIALGNSKFYNAINIKPNSSMV